MGSNKKAATRGKGRGSSKAIRKPHYPAESSRSQCARLLRHLQEHGALDTREARLRLDIMHPGGRVYDLRWRAGIDIVSVIDPDTRIATYVLRPGGADV